MNDNILEYMPLLLREESWAILTTFEVESALIKDIIDYSFKKEIEALNTVGMEGQVIVHYIPEKEIRIVWIWKYDRWVRNTKRASDE